MFTHIMVPVDLAHQGAQDRALRVAGDLAKTYGARITYVAVTSPQPGAVAQGPEDFADKLATFAAGQAKTHALPTVDSHAITVPDPATELDRALERAAHDVGCDLVVMASHIPRRFDFASHGGRVATHTDVSVMLVRG